MLHDVWVMCNCTNDTQHFHDSFVYEFDSNKWVQDIYDIFYTPTPTQTHTYSYTDYKYIDDIQNGEFPF